jgi:hypothetical protein
MARLNRRAMYYPGNGGPGKTLGRSGSASDQWAFTDELDQGLGP